MIVIVVLVAVAVAVAVATVAADIAIAAETRFVRSSSRNSGDSCIRSLVIACRSWRRLVVVIVVDSAAAATAKIPGPNR